ncbi:MAG: hypothetical protein AAGI63_01550 [Planctomycetota bacterium]
MIPRIAWLSLAVTFAPCVVAADRTTLLLPRAADASTGNALPTGQYPDDAMGRHAGAGWRSYVRLWKAHHQSPGNRDLRRYLGLPLEDSFAWSARRGRSAPRYLRWSAGKYAQIETAHFVIFSRADEMASRRVAEDLERCYWAWTQMFFPIWEGAPLVRSSLTGLAEGNTSVEEHLKGNSARITIRRKLRVVLFRDAEEYQKTLAPDYPGVERSTGFYASDKQTTFLYASEEDDAATRRHELVHQLFREATRSGLGRSFPGEREGFWIIEGIAGYFESLHMTDDVATVGGWDCSRLQFARYRVLVLGDLMPMEELVADGRVAAQQRSDIARWYAHAIAQTHRLLDSGDADRRAWIYDQLSERYRIASSKDWEVNADQVLEDSGKRLRAFLQLRSDQVLTNPVARPLRNLVLAECALPSETIQSIAPQSELNWLDLTRIRVTTNDVIRLVPDPSTLSQLRLEATAVDGSLASWLAKTSGLVELDLSWTPVDDSTIQSIVKNQSLDVLYLTGTRVSDTSIDAIIALPKLQTIDLQRTAVTESGLKRLRNARPQVELNPLRLVESGG